jgi:hypothetical protein
MENIEAKLSHIKNKLESAAFLVTQEGSAKEAHKEIVRSLVILSDIESGLALPEMAGSSRKANVDEINKVGRRLKLWAKRPHQINSKILTAFLRLERSGASVIKESDLRNALPEESSFESNFTQMRIVAEKNYGKVFEQYGEKVTLWEPVISDIRKFERIVFEETEIATRNPVSRISTEETHYAKEDAPGYPPITLKPSDPNSFKKSMGDKIATRDHNLDVLHELGFKQVRNTTVFHKGDDYILSPAVAEGTNGKYWLIYAKEI